MPYTPWRVLTFIFGLVARQPKAPPDRWSEGFKAGHAVGFQEGQRAAKRALRH